MPVPGWCRRQPQDWAVGGRWGSLVSLPPGCCQVAENEVGGSRVSGKLPMENSASLFCWDGRLLVRPLWSGLPGLSQIQIPGRSPSGPGQGRLPGVSPWPEGVLPVVSGLAAQPQQESTEGLCFFGAWSVASRLPERFLCTSDSPPKVESRRVI